MANYERVPMPRDIQNSLMSFLDRYEDHVLLRHERVIVLNKPGGLAMTDRSAFLSSGVVEIAEDIEGRKLRPVNRLDRDTSGAVLLALDRHAAGFLAKQFGARKVDKNYLAIVAGEFSEVPHDVNLPLKEISTSQRRMHVQVSDEEGSKSARTGFRRIALFEDESGNRSSLLAVKLYTGRTHQIRVHSSAIGHFIIGDSIYGDEDAQSRQLLHSHETSIILPGQTNPTTIIAPMPLDFWGYIADKKVLAGQENIAALAA